MSSNPARIIIVEDNPADVALLRHALAEQQEPFELTILSDGEAALRFVEQQRSAQEPTPCVILLDLHLPRVDGNSVLRAISREPELTHVQIAVWTTLASPEERELALSFGADHYQLKPTTIEGFWELAARLLEMCAGRVARAAT